ncbi:CARDB domain-containing protein [Roseomonas sp. AR75]|uniref:CARDB domain-containing protein n=1 Tax=Roseomonas sp. AR75 TaxID=2562311 RepID=UPI0010C06C73|nr:CARDB domain-containing protein [Roseomonas sp. AR75]
MSLPSNLLIRTGGQVYHVAVTNQLADFSATNHVTGVAVTDSHILSDLFSLSSAIILVDRLYSGYDQGLLGARDATGAAIDQLKTVADLDADYSTFKTIASGMTALLVKGDPLAVYTEFSLGSLSTITSEIKKAFFFSAMQEYFEYGDKAVVSAYTAIQIIRRSASGTVHAREDIVAMTGAAVGGSAMLQAAGQLVSKSDLLDGTWWSDLRELATFLAGLILPKFDLQLEAVAPRVKAWVDFLKGVEYGSTEVLKLWEMALYTSEVRFETPPMFTDASLQETLSYFESHGGQTGGPGDDTIHGNAQPNRLEGGGGDDDLRGDGGPDTLLGGIENDTLFGGSGNDSLLGGDGADSLKGEANSDTLVGGANNDTLYGDEHGDSLHGGSGNDLIDGGDGTDTASFEAFLASDINLSVKTDGSFQVTTPKEGTDTLIRVERITFGSITRDVADWLDYFKNPPVPPPGGGGGGSSAPPGGSVNSGLSVVRTNHTIAANGTLKLTDIYAPSAWRDNDGAPDLTWFFVKDRTPGGGFLTRDGTQLDEDTVYTDRITNIGSYGFKGAGFASVDEIGFNIVDSSGDYSPSFAAGAGAKVTTFVPTSSGPDLVIEKGSFTGSTFKKGDSVEVSWEVKNKGAGDAGESSAGVYLSADATITAADTYLGKNDTKALTAGTTDPNEKLTVTLPGNLASGKWYLGVLADRTGAVDEGTNEGNNFWAKEITVGSTAKPDLVIEKGSFTGSTFKKGDSVEVSWEVRNKGAGDAGESSAGVYLSADATITAADTYLGKNDTKALTAGTTDPNEKLTVTLPGNLASGKWYLGVLADRTGAVDEGTNEGNNFWAKEITVGSTAKPDLVIEGAAISGSSFGRGATARLDWQVKNAGSGSAGSSEVGIYLSTNTSITDSDDLLDTNSTAALGPGDIDRNQFETFTIPKSISPGNYYVGLIADHKEKIDESSEGNNNDSYFAISIW